MEPLGKLSEETDILVPTESQGQGSGAQWVTGSPCVSENLQPVSQHLRVSLKAGREEKQMPALWFDLLP